MGLKKSREILPHSGNNEKYFSLAGKEIDGDNSTATYTSSIAQGFRPEGV